MLLAGQKPPEAASAADITDVLAADTTGVLSAAKAADGSFCPARSMTAKTWACQNNGFGAGWPPHGSKSTFDRLPRQGIVRRSCCRGWLGPTWPKMDRNIWGSGRVGSSFGWVFRTFSKMVREGPWTIIWGSGGAGKVYLGDSAQVRFRFS